MSSTPVALAWTSDTSVPWLTVEPIAGTTPVIAALRVNALGLAPGRYEGEVTFHSGGVLQDDTRNLSIGGRVIYLPLIAR